MPVGDGAGTSGNKKTVNGGGAAPNEQTKTCSHLVCAWNSRHAAPFCAVSAVCSCELVCLQSAARRSWRQRAGLFARRNGAVEAAGARCARCAADGARQGADHRAFDGNALCNSGGTPKAGHRAVSFESAPERAGHCAAFQNGMDCFSWEGRPAGCMDACSAKRLQH